MPIHIRIREAIEGGEGERHPERHRLGPPDREILGHEFAKDDLDERDDREGQAVGKGGDRRLADDADMGQWRLDPSRDERFAHPAQAQAGQGDAELGGGEITVEVFRDPQGKPEPPILLPLLPHGLKLGFPDLDEGEFGRDEKRVGRDQQNDDNPLLRVLIPQHREHPLKLMELSRNGYAESGGRIPRAQRDHLNFGSSYLSHKSYPSHRATQLTLPPIAIG
jgi:hypothetical protein